jgi:hypothetical protein
MIVHAHELVPEEQKDAVAHGFFQGVSAPNIRFF